MPTDWKVSDELRNLSMRWCYTISQTTSHTFQITVLANCFWHTNGINIKHLWNDIHSIHVALESIIISSLWKRLINVSKTVKTNLAVYDRNMLYLQTSFLQNPFFVSTSHFYISQPLFDSFLIGVRVSTENWG